MKVYTVIIALLHLTIEKARQVKTLHIQCIVNQLTKVDSDFIVLITSVDVQ